MPVTNDSTPAAIPGTPAPAAGDDDETTMSVLLDRPGHGALIPLQAATSDSLPAPGRARLALEALSEFLTDRDHQAVPAASDALRALHQHLWKRELDYLATTGLTACYLIIRPANPLKPPAPADAARIRDAITTLAHLGMLYGNGDDE